MNNTENVPPSPPPLNTHSSTVSYKLCFWCHKKDKAASVYISWLTCKVQKVLFLCFICSYLWLCTGSVTAGAALCNKLPMISDWHGLMQNSRPVCRRLPCWLWDTSNIKDSNLICTSMIYSTHFTLQQQKMCFCSLIGRPTFSCTLIAKKTPTISYVYNVTPVKYEYNTIQYQPFLMLWQGEKMRGTGFFFSFHQKQIVRHQQTNN